MYARSRLALPLPMTMSATISATVSAPLLVALLISLTAAVPAMAQSWPAKPIHVIVPSAPGGPNDTIMRAVGTPLGEALGQPIVVEDRGGAEGIIGAEACAKAAPDGHLLCATAINVITYTPTLRLNLPYEPRRDFIPIAHLGFSDSAIVVHRDVPVNTLEQLVALARAKPEDITWASFGTNTSSWYYMEWFRKVKGVQFLGVPYKTSQQQITAVVAGESKAIYAGLLSILPQVKAGRLKALAVSGDRRQALLPDVPTIAEAGFEQLPIRTWYGMFGVTGTPAPIIQRLNREVVKIVATPAMDKFLNVRGVTPVLQSAEEFAAFVKQDRDGFETLARILQLPRE